MGNIALAIFLILFGVTMLVSTEIPKWVVGIAACITGLIILAGGGLFKRSQ